MVNFKYCTLFADDNFVIKSLQGLFCYSLLSSFKKQIFVYFFPRQQDLMWLKLTLFLDSSIYVNFYQFSSLRNFFSLTFFIDVKDFTGESCRMLSLITRQPSACITVFYNFLQNSCG